MGLFGGKNKRGSGGGGQVLGNKRWLNNLYFTRESGGFFGAVSLLVGGGALFLEWKTSHDGALSVFDYLNIHHAQGAYDKNMSMICTFFAIALILSPFHAIFRDADGHYSWRNAIMSSEQLMGVQRTEGMSGWAHGAWHFVDNWISIVAILFGIATDVAGYYQWEQYPMGDRFWYAMGWNIFFSIVVNATALLVFIRAWHFIAAAINEHFRGRINAQHRGRVLIQPVKQAALPAGPAARVAPMPNAAPSPRQAPPPDATTGQYRYEDDPSKKTAAPSAKGGPTPIPTAARAHAAQGSMSGLEDLQPNPSRTRA